MTNAKLLEQLKLKEQKADLPLKEGAKNLVFGEGNPEAEVFFLGEAPGRQEDETGRPFVGQAGKILTKLIESIGLKREDVYITSVLRYRPSKNRDPKPAEIAAVQPFLDAQIKIIKPKIIVTLGRYSLAKFLSKAKIAQIHGKPQPVTWDKQPVTIIPMYHPAAVLYRRNLQKVLEKDFKTILMELKQ